MKYRREIDGLRAVAVVPVILFHAGFPSFSGGFVGVDVFFVISGYLITSILIGDLERGDFSILRFYERRARRILPALTFVVLCCVPFAWMWMLPDQLKDFAQSVAAVGLFASNVLFWIESGYFEAAAELKPLLHTWSLAVEEQYYVVFPVLLLVLWRFGMRTVLGVIVVLTLASLLLSEYLWRAAPSANFFLAPSRIWELLAGSLCAFALHNRAPVRNETLSLAGLALLVVAVLFYDETTPFPSLWALVPVGGTVLIILFAAPGTLTARVLSLRIMVGIGLISYSAYLWHQPLFAFARIRNVLTPEPEIMLALSALSLVLAALTWRYVEQPFRGRTPVLLPRRAGIFAASGIGLAAFVAVGVAGHLLDGFPGRLDAASRAFAALGKEDNPHRIKNCQLTNDRELKDHPLPKCSDFMIDGRIDVGVIGDSHAGAISHPVQVRLKQEGIASYSVTFAGCVGLPGFNRLAPELAGPGCNAYNLAMRQFFREKNVPIILVSSRFTLFLEGERFDNGEGGVEYGNDGRVDVIDAKRTGQDETARRLRVMEAYRRELLTMAEEFDVLLVYPIPEAGWDVPVTMAQMRTFSNGDAPLSLSTSMEAYNARNRDVITLFDSLDHPRIHRIRPDEILCDTMVPGRCVNARDNQLFYRDDDHLSQVGAELLAEPIVETVTSILEQHEAYRR